MKARQIHRTANIAWSPVNHSTVLLAAGTSAHQVDASFDTAASLDVFEFNPASDDAELPLRATLPCEHRIFKLAWSPHTQIDQVTSNAGALVAGVENGIVVYSADAVLGQDKGKAVIKQVLSHTGPVQALDVSTLLPNLVASGASESEVFVWDLNSLGEAIPVGPKSFPVDEVTSVSWNRKINYILASVYPNRCALWDLRKHESIIKLGDQNSRIRYKSVNWNPEIATQLALASEDDHSPIVQIWDLRNASSAVKTLEGHTRGILSLAWCPHDNDLLLTTGKDGNVYCWDVSETGRGEIVYALPTSKQWAFEVRWCPRIPSVFSTSSTTVGIHSISGEDDAHAAAASSSMLADSFPGMNIVAPAASKEGMTHHVRKAPKWLRRPGALAFSFDGKLVKTFTDGPLVGLELGQLVLDRHTIEEALILEQRIAQNQGREFCDEKIAAAKSYQDREEWKFIRTLYEPDHPQPVLRLLGYSQETRIPDITPSSSETILTNGEKSSQDSLAEPVSKKGVGSSFRIPTGKDLKGSITVALLCGNVDKAVELCLENGKEAEGVMLSLLTSAAQLPDLFWKAHQIYFSSHGSDLSSLICALVKHDAQFLLEKARIDSWKEVVAAFLNYFPREEYYHLIQRLGERLENELNGIMVNNSILCYLSSGNVDAAVDVWLKRNVKSTTESFASLHATMEKVLIADAALSGGRPHAFGEKSSKLFQDYAQCLASQGEVGLALRYLLRDTSNSLASLKHRLYNALGPRAAARETGLRQSPLGNSQIVVLRRPGKPVPAGIPSGQFGRNALSGMVPSFPPGPAFNPAPSFAANQPFAPAPSYAAPPSFASPAAPPPLTNTYPQDFLGPFPAPPAAGLYNPASFVPSEPPRPPSRPPVPPFPASIAAPSNNGLYTAQPSNYFGQSPAHLASQSNVYSSPSTDPPLPSYQHVKAVGGWNDPPPLNLNNRRSSNATPLVNPITQPLPQVPGTEAPPSVPQYPVPGGGMGGGPGYGMPGIQATNIFQPQITPSVSNETPFIPSQPDSHVPKEKSPIPAEHIPISEGFATLLHCVHEKASAAGDGHSVRKLEDVRKKLDLLDDCLREERLSGVTLMGLHQMVQCVQNGDFLQALAVHAHMSTSASFMEIGSFMPSIKILLQMAQRF